MLLGDLADFAQIDPANRPTASASHSITLLEALKVTQVRRPTSGNRPAQTLFLIVLDPQRVSG